MIRVKVYANAGTGNHHEDFLELEHATTVAEIYQEARELAIDLTGFEYTAFVLVGEEEVSPEEFIAANGQPPTANKPEATK